MKAKTKKAGKTSKPANVIASFVPITAPDDPRMPAALDFVNGFLEREAAAKAERHQKKCHPPRVIFSESEAHQLGYRAIELGRMLGAVKRLSWLMEERDDDTANAAAAALEAIAFAGAIKADVIAVELGAGPGGYYDDEELGRIARAAGYTRGGAK